MENTNIQVVNLEKIKNGILRKFPLLGATMSILKFEENTEITTACTNGEKVYYSPNFINKLTYEEQIFVFSHEIMHVAFDHILRSKDKNPFLWNVATDAVINQMLQAEKLPMIKGGIDMAEAINKSAEEMYNKLLKEYEQAKEKRKKQGNSQESNQNENQENKDSQPQQNNQERQAGNAGHAPHEIWKEAVEKAEKQKEENKNGKSGEGSEGENLDEKGFTQENRNFKNEIGKKIREKLEKQKQEAQANEYTLSTANCPVTPVISWKKLLKRELTLEQDRWSYRRANEDNDYQARIGSMDVDDEPETEVMLDVSGSIDDNFLKGFLKQLKPLLKESKLRVGCFDEFVYPFKEIKSIKDIDNFRVSRRSPWTENWDAAVKAFSKKREVNKIVFTDGCPCPGVMPKPETKNINVIWLVFNNRNFKPCCGKVIYLDRSDLNFVAPKQKDDDLTF